MGVLLAPSLVTARDKPYVVANSLVSAAASSEYQHRNYSAADSKRIATISSHLKWTSATSHGVIFGSGDAGGPNDSLMLRRRGDNQRLELLIYMGGALVTQVLSSASYTDTTDWHHYACVIDTSQAASADRFKLYYDGSQITSFAVDTRQGQNTDTALGDTKFFIGRLDYAATGYLDAKVSDWAYQDGVSESISNLTDGGSPVDKSSLDFGAEGVLLQFGDNSTVAALGTDTSGNGNDMTVVNFSTTDQSTDVPA